MIAVYIIIGIVVVLLLFFAGTYNSLVRLRNRVKNAWAQIDVQLKRRHDFIPNLVETAKGYMTQERGTFEAVIKARNFREAARALNVRLEYAGVQYPEDKPYIESFFGSYKTEESYRNEYNSLAETKTGWVNYRAWYRNDRLHQALWYKSPRDYAKITFQSKLLVA